jgi:hypothetical protein
MSEVGRASVDASSWASSRTSSPAGVNRFTVDTICAGWLEASWDLDDPAHDNSLCPRVGTRC